MHFHTEIVWWNWQVFLSGKARRILFFMKLMNKLKHLRILTDFNWPKFSPWVTMADWGFAPVHSASWADSKHYAFPAGLIYQTSRIKIFCWLPADHASSMSKSGRRKKNWLCGSKPKPLIFGTGSKLIQNQNHYIFGTEGKGLCGKSNSENNISLIELFN